MGSSLELFAIIEKVREPERQVNKRESPDAWDPRLRLHGKICVGFKYKGGAQLGINTKVDFGTIETMRIIGCVKDHGVYHTLTLSFAPRSFCFAICGVGATKPELSATRTWVAPALFIPFFNNGI